MILMTKNINLTNEELELIQGGADPYGKNPNGRYDWEIEPVLTLLVHGFCPRGTYTSQSPIYQQVVNFFRFCF